VSYWTPRAEAPITVCNGGGCDRKLDCRRYLERRDLVAHAEQLPERDMWENVRKLDAHGRPIGWEQACRHYLPREG
jgi:hypothetical protein